MEFMGEITGKLDSKGAEAESSRGGKRLAGATSAASKSPITGSFMEITGETALTRSGTREDMLSVKSASKPGVSRPVSLSAYASPQD